MLEAPADAPVTCHRCGHGYHWHRPACTTGCDCAGFRWVDPSSTPDAGGYSSDPRPIAGS